MIEPALIAEIDRARRRDLVAYLSGASRDGTFNRVHRTYRITQRDRRWLEVLQLVLDRLGRRGWLYQEGARQVWALETTFKVGAPVQLSSSSQECAFVRGYFDAEGGVPRRFDDRFYVQFVQKDFTDLERVRNVLNRLAIECGRLHNPSERVDPNYWRFYVLSRSHSDFIRLIRSWHPGKRAILEARVAQCSSPPREATAPLQR